MAPDAASRIPKLHARTTPSTVPTQTSSSHPSTQNLYEEELTALHASLTALQCPQISVEDLRRLCNGTFKDVLLFVGEHVRGRQAVADARHQLRRLYEQSGYKRVALSKDGDSSQTRLQRATSRLNGAKQALDVLQKQLEERQNAFNRVCEESALLQEDLDQKKCANLLLSTLHAKSSVRVQRFEEITRLLNMERKTIAKHDEVQDSVFVQDELSKPTPLEKVIEPSHTQDVLAGLHEYHTHLSQLAFKTESLKSTDPIAALRSSIADNINLPETDDGVAEILEQCKTLARNRAQAKVRYRPLAAIPIPEEALKGHLIEFRLKEEELRRLAGVRVAQRFLRGHLIESIESFKFGTGMELQTALTKEAARARGHVELLMHSVLNLQVSKGNEKGLFEKEVKKVYGLNGNITRQWILEEIKQMIHSAHQRQEFLLASKLVPRPSTTPEHASLIRKHRESERRAHEQATMLLQRKLDKSSELGDQLVTDIVNTLKEISSLNRLR